MGFSVKLSRGGLLRITPIIDGTNILNLSLTYSLTIEETSVLEKGLLFIPTPHRLDKQGLKRDLYQYHRRLKILEHFGYNKDSEKIPFILPSMWEPEDKNISSGLRDLIEGDKEMLHHFENFKFPKSNLTKAERKALRNLQGNKDIIIKAADKGSKICIMDRSDYVLEAHRQLENRKHYLPLKESIQLKTQQKVRNILDKLYSKKYITYKQHTYLYGDDPPRKRKLYLLPKIHKNPESWTVPNRVPAGRPIVSDCSSESYGAAEYIDFYLNPLSQKHPSYVKDTYAFVELLKSVEFPLGAMIFSIDVDALYTNIETSLGLEAVRKVFDQYPDASRPDEELLELLKLGLTCNDFEFDSKMYLQIYGTAMGKKFAPAYANIYMAEWERTVFPKCPKLPLLYLRYLDDIFGVWTHSKEEFGHFMEILNSHHESISLKFDLQTEKINFLDTEVFIKEKTGGRWGLGTRVYFKPTDTHALLHRSSYHPRHTYRGIIKSQLVRFRRICVEEADVQLATETLFRALRPRGYSRTFLRAIKTEVRELFENGREPTTNLEEKRLIPLVTTYSPAAVALNRSTKERFLEFQRIEPQLEEFRIIAAYKRNKNLSDILVRATLPVRTNGPLKLYFKTIKFIENKYTGKGSAVMQDFSLESINLVYGIICKACGKIYVGETKNSLKERLKQHIYLIKKPKKHTILYEHFWTHGLANFSILGLEKGRNWNYKRRRGTENKWIEKLNTIHPFGLNEKE